MLQCHVTVIIAAMPYNGGLVAPANKRPPPHATVVSCHQLAQQLNEEQNTLYQASTCFLVSYLHSSSTMLASVWS